MARKATGAQVAIAYVAETTWGTTPASPTMKELRCVSETLDHTRGGLVSEELKSHRQTQNLTHGTREAEGEIVCEFGDFLDDWLEAALYGVLSSNVLKLAQSLKQFTVERRVVSIGQSMQYTGIRPNGLKLNLAPEEIAKVTFPILGKDLSIAIDGLGGPSGWLVNEPVTPPAIGDANFDVDTGATNPAANDEFVVYQAGSTTTLRSDQVYKVSSYAANNVVFTPPLDVALVNNDILHFFRPATVVTNNDPMDAFSGSLSEGGSAQAIITGLDLEISQGAELAKVIGANVPQGIIEGGVAVTGTLRAYVENMTLFNKWLNENYSTLQFALTKSGGSTYTWLLPRIKYTGGKLNKPAGGGPIIEELPFVAVYDTTEATSVKITKS